MYYSGSALKGTPLASPLLYGGIYNSRASCMLLGGRGCVTQAVEHDEAAFLNLSVV